MVLAGSCAIVAHIRGINLHIANLGDSAAVLGLYNQGIISAMPLSKSHCIDNADEVGLFLFFLAAYVKLGGIKDTKKDTKMKIFTLMKLLPH